MSPHSHKVIIFDWDDTLCPSSFIDQWKVENAKDLPLHFQNLFYEVGRCAEKCLDEAAKYGEVILITNSDDGWVKFSAERFLPKLLPCLDRYRIVSARTRYERFYPNQPLCWKAAAFAHEVNEIYTASTTKSFGTMKPIIRQEKKLSSEEHGEDDIASLVSTEGMNSTASTSLSSLTDDFASIKPTSKIRQPTRKSNSIQHVEKEVISFGDSMEERTSVKIVANQLQAIPKSVMFINAPSPVQIIGQLHMLTENMDYVCNQKSALDLEIGPRQAIKSADEFLYDKPYCKPPPPANMHTKYPRDELNAISSLRCVTNRSNGDVCITSNHRHL